MNCPRCEHHGLDPVAVDRSVRVDWCSGCGGAFYETGELDAVLGASPALDERSTTPGLSCPACTTAMVELRWPAGGAVRIDACPSCKGHWLDRGELVHLKEHLASTRGSSSSAGPASHIPLSRLPAQVRTLQWRWVAGGAAVMLLSFACILGGLSFFDLLDELRDRSGTGEQVLALWSLLLCYPLGGLLIGRGSSGYTIWEAALAAIPTTLVLGLAVGGFNLLQTVGLILAGFVLALLGAVAGERLSGR